jgi:hypothetical protein
VSICVHVGSFFLIVLPVTNSMHIRELAIKSKRTEQAAKLAAKPAACSLWGRVADNERVPYYDALFSHTK